MRLCQIGFKYKENKMVMKRCSSDNFRDFNKINLDKSFLLKIKHKAIRLKIWYRLNNIEKTIFENKFLNKIYGNGLKEIIKIANSLGNKNSLKWIRFLFDIYFSYS